MSDKPAVFTYGRMNPPTVGHEKLINTVLSHAKKIGGKAYIFTSHSQDEKKNPLSGEEKVGYMKKAFPKAHIQASSKDMPSFMHVAKHLNDIGHKHLVMVAGSDRTEEYHNLLHKYNGPDKHYNFDSIKVVSAGHRDPDAEGVEGMSGSKMREAAKSGNKELFKSGLMSGLKDQHKEEIYNKVRSSMGIKEQMEKLIPFLLMNEKQRRELLPSYKIVEEKEFDENDFDDDIKKLDWHDIFHLYDDDEVDVSDKVKNLVEETVLSEDLNIMQRIKKRIDFMKTEKRREVARHIRLNRASPLDRLKRRATLAARKLLERRMLAGRIKSDISVDEKNRIENRLKKMGKLQQTLAARLLPKIRDIEKKRLQRTEMFSFKDFFKINEGDIAPGGALDPYKGPEGYPGKKPKDKEQKIPFRASIGESKKQ